MNNVSCSFFVFFTFVSFNVSWITRFFSFSFVTWACFCCFKYCQAWRIHNNLYPMVQFCHNYCANEWTSKHIKNNNQKQTKNWQKKNHPVKTQWNYPQKCWNAPQQACNERYIPFFSSAFSTSPTNLFIK